MRGGRRPPRAFEPWLRLFGPHYFGKFRVFFPDGRLEIGLGCFQVHRAVKIILERALEAFVQPLVVGAGVAHVDVGRGCGEQRDVVLAAQKIRI